MISGYNIQDCSRADVDHLVRAHYLHKWPGVVVAVLGLTSNAEPGFIGCIVFTLPPRETLRRYEVKVGWELARLFIKDGTPRNMETWFVARAIRWVKKNRPEVECLISYADPAAGHKGTIYQAGNWISDGRTDQERKSARVDLGDPLTGKIYGRWSQVPAGVQPVRVPRVSKFRYVYWLSKYHEALRQHERNT